MKDRNVRLTRTELADVTAGSEPIPVIPAPPPGYEYCSYWRTCPNFDYKVCIFKISGISQEEPNSNCSL
jgi:hypothetical protein